MHKLGIGFLIANVILAVAAVVLTARLVNTRNYWMQQVEQREKQIESNDGQIAQKEKELSDLRAELVRQRMTWDTMQLADNSRANADGTVIVGAGQNMGVGVVPEGSPPPIVHVFVPAGPQGQESLYAGPFRVAEAGAAQSQLEPLFRVQPEDVQKWTPGTWRLWQVVPSDAPSRVVSLSSEVVEKLEAVASRQATLALQQKAVEHARAHLDGRNKELLGDPQAPKIEGVPEVSEGLVAALRNAESSRNSGLAELGRLRREVDDAYARLTRLVSENVELARPSASGTPAPEISFAR